MLARPRPTEAKVAEVAVAVRGALKKAARERSNTSWPCDVARCFHVGTAAKKFVIGFTAGLVSGLTFGRAKSLYAKEMEKAIAAARKPVIRVLGSSAWSAISRGVAQAGL
ncbi:hypothetical protein ABTY98_01130 [Streptomyces sp. NPDC096040]|uniref:hypothetical protein n=1 Tax=Streptomyces sp. NPDC096040 TaxID=3155541 RepID=UPI00332D9C79